MLDRNQLVDLGGNVNAHMLDNGVILLSHFTACGLNVIHMDPSVVNSFLTFVARSRHDFDG
jgi:hypothetical protein